MIRARHHRQTYKPFADSKRLDVNFMMARRNCANLEQKKKTSPALDGSDVDVSLMMARRNSAPWCPKRDETAKTSTAVNPIFFALNAIAMRC